MAKISGKYEIVYIIDPAQGEEGIAALVEKFKAMVEAEGTLTSIEEWGKRRLAYPINDLPEGYDLKDILREEQHEKTDQREKEDADEHHCGYPLVNS